MGDPAVQMVTGRAAAGQRRVPDDSASIATPASGKLHITTRAIPASELIMNDPQSPRSAADRNLLFGILALQMDFVTRDALITAMNAWALAKSRPLGQILMEQKALGPDEHALLDALVQ